MIPVSVLMPVYNAECYVSEAIESILAQTFSDFEFLIIDDGSTDDSNAILQQYAARDDRIRLASRPNRGLVATLNELLGMARGEFAARMDADDVALPERFALQVAYLRDHPAVVCVGGGYQMIDGRGRILNDFHLPQDDATLQDLALAGHCPLTHPCVMMRRQVAIEAGGYREEMLEAEDFDLWLRMGERGRIENLGQVILKYRNHIESKGSKNQDRMSYYFKFASDQACDRRGIPRRYNAECPYRAVDNPRSKHDYSLVYGWWGFHRGDRSTAIHYALEAIRWIPWRTDGWRLLACALLKPMGN